MSASHFAWAVLQLAPTTDVREIKRAYARLAKLHRADEAPVAFQQIRAAYEAALQLAAAAAAPPAHAQAENVAIDPPKRIRQQAQALIAQFDAAIAPTDAIARLSQWLAQHALDGLEDRAWFEIG